ncbi:MAG TPA: hypothetical protein VMT95_12110 [Candidatus Binatia bacterium]|nr:hypothetical protein [Candidatus Binatia bacterium]
MIAHFKHHALVGASAFLLAACVSSQSFAPAATTQTPTAAQAYARNLLYVYLNSVELYTYPRGKPLGSLGVGGALCSDKFGNIVVAGSAGTSQVWVYPHGGSQPIAHMYNPNSPNGCSVDPRSENIAVAGAYPGSVVIFPYNAKRGWRLAHEYFDRNIHGSKYCAYDHQGNIFLDGVTYSLTFILAELRKGSSTFTTITLDRVIHAPGSMQWDGKDLVIEDAGKTSSSPAVIYRFAISGRKGHEIGATTLTNSVANGQFLIIGRTIIGPAKPGSLFGLGFWPYPKGGAPGRFLPLSTYNPLSALALSPK